MDELILAALQGSISPADAARLDAWRRASPRNEAHYRDLARLWVLSVGDDPLAVHVSRPPSDLFRTPRAAPEPMPLRTVPARPAVAPPAALDAHGRRSTRPAWLLAVTGLAAAAAIAFAAVRSDAPVAKVERTASLSASEFVTDTSEMVTARLDDGSVVRLAPESRLRVLPDAERREVWLDGHAFFAIAPDSAHPFRIRTRAGDVEVLGTRFDLRVIGTALHLVVTEGRVALTANGERRMVVAGQTARIVDERPIVEPTARVDTLLSWMGGFLAFQNTPLRQVARELEQRYDVRVLVPDSALGERTVTAWFTGQELERILNAVCRAVDAHCTLRDGVASIEP